MMKKSIVISLFATLILGLVGCDNATTIPQTTTEYGLEIEAEVAEEEVTPEVTEAPVTEMMEETVEEVTEVTAEVDEIVDEAVEEAAEDPTPEAAEDASVPEETPVAEATAEVAVKPVAESISAKVNGVHNVGDTLSAADFTITVNMSDGSKVKNPAGWTADKLFLDSESTVINVSYNGMNTTVTVKASPAAQPQAPAVAPVQETPVQQPQAPVTNNGAVTHAAIEDAANYAVSRGWAKESVTNSVGGVTQTAHMLSKNGHYYIMTLENNGICCAVVDGELLYGVTSMSTIYNFINKY